MPLVRYVFGQPYVRAIALTTTTANFFRSALLAVLLVYLVLEAETSAGAIGVAFPAATSALSLQR
jgi:hypothetical protein